MVLTVGNGLTRLLAPPDELFIEDVSRTWLFPRLAAVVHHGGAGTTGAGLRAGVSTIVTPLASDQYAWAERVVNSGAGPPSPPMKNLTAERLGQAFNTTVQDSAMRARARALGQKIRAENGIARAVEVIEHLAS